MAILQEKRLCYDVFRQIRYFLHEDCHGLRPRNDTDLCNCFQNFKVQLWLSAFISKTKKRTIYQRCHSDQGEAAWRNLRIFVTA